MPIFGQEKPKITRAYITIKSDLKGKLRIEYADYSFGNDVTLARKTVPVSETNPTASILSQGNEYFTYFTLKGPPDPRQTQDKLLFLNYLLEPNDNLLLNIRQGVMRFSGRGAAKNNCLLDIEKAEQAFEKQYSDSLVKLPVKYRNSPDKLDSAHISYYPEDFKEGVSDFSPGLLSAGMKVLSSYKNLLSPRMFQLIKADLIAKSENEMIRSLNFFCTNMMNAASPAYLTQVRERLIAIYETGKKNDFQAVDKSVLIYSSGYLNYLINDIRRARDEKKDAYNYIKEAYSGLLRDRLLTLYFTRYYHKDPNATLYLKDSLKFVQSRYCRDILMQVLNITADGTKAYAFSLPNTKGEQVRLEDFKGKVVVMDFWYTGCAGCAGLAPHMRAISEQLKNDSSIVFVSVSIDRDKAKWISSVKSQKYTNEQSIDLYTNGLGENHPLIKHYNIFGYPRILVIGKDGRIYNSSPKRPADQSTERGFIKMLLAAKYR